VRWREFLHAHLGEVFAADFFTVEVLTLTGLVRHHVLFVIDLATRRVEIASVVRCPDGTWMKQVVRNLTAFDGFLLPAKYLVVDRDPLFTGAIRRMLAAAGVETVRLPAAFSELERHFERFVGSIPRECLDQVIPLGADHLRRVVHEYATHFNAERPRQGLGNRLIEPTSAANGDGPILCRERLGGLLRFYHREAA
jgi:transposase InsO family protein